MTTEETQLEVLKEINLTIRHWETLILATSKDHLTYIAVTVGGIGTAMAWPAYQWDLRNRIVQFLLVVAILLSISGACTLASQKNYMSRLYEERGKLLLWPVPRNKSRLAGWTVPVSISVLAFTGVCAVLGLRYFPERPAGILASVRLGKDTDLSMTDGFVQSDFEGACAIGEVKPPPGVNLKKCAY
jgi:hypothetical protein